MKAMRYIAGILILFIGTSAFVLNEDPALIAALKQRVKQYNQSYPQEKVYVQLDKPFYKPGEDVWFNVFVLNANNHQPTSTSDVVYVELLDPKGAVAGKIDLVIREGTARGDFEILNTMVGGIYKLRAYTQWMKNFGQEFKKDIQVQRIVTPRLLLKLDYEKESYGAGDRVDAKLTIRNLKNEEVAGASVRVIARIGGVDVFNSTVTSGDKGIAEISFTLPADLATTDGLLQAIVSTQGVEESISRSIPIVLNKIAISFFPEGGYGLEKVSSKIAFKATNEFGKGADVSGSILNDRKEVVASFESFHMGMGAFTLRAEPGVQYFARIEKPVAGNMLIQIPRALADGYSFGLKEKQSKKLIWSVGASSSSEVYLVGLSHGEIVYSSKVNVNEGDNSIEVPTESFPAGICVFTLFDASGVSRCERLVFVNETKGLNIELKTDQKQYQPGEKVKLTIKAKDNEGNPVAAKLSLSVVDDQLVSFADDKQDNILSSMLLSSEVKGEIQEPSFYFDPKEPKASQALDFLLMTHGWRRFTWKEIDQPRQTIVYTPERLKDVSGRILGKSGTPVKSEVTLLEMGGQQRIDKIETTDQGFFLFRNVDPTVPLLIFAREPNKIALQHPATATVLEDYEFEEGVAAVGQPAELQDPAVAAPQDNNEEMLSQGGLDVSMDEDEKQLSEVVVIGYGAELKRSLTGAVVSISNNDLVGGAEVENSLQGRVAGLAIQRQTGSPATATQISIRGISSLAGGRGEPLYIINGVPLPAGLNQNFSNGSLIGPEQIQSIEVMHSGEGVALYGSLAANGVIMITTRTRLNISQFSSAKKYSRYAMVKVTPRKFAATREFFTAPARPSGDRERDDFRTTVYWNADIVTDAKGEAQVSFNNSDAVSAFRITAEGFSNKGLLGRKEEVYSTLLPLSLDVKLPAFLGYADKLKLPVKVKNETDHNISARISINIPQDFSVEEDRQQNIEVAPGITQTFWYHITPPSVEDNYRIEVLLNSHNFKDKITQDIAVHPVGFPATFSVNSTDTDKTIDFSISAAELNSINARVTGYPDVLTDLTNGIEGMLKEPYGCFEQTSSTTFPNVLVLQFLKSANAIRPGVAAKAEKLIETGYKRLISYESKGGGFEWFGSTPAHEGLTAYGILEFTEMKKVYPDVDQKMIDRTTRWLLGRRDGKGGFRQSDGGLDDFTNGVRSIGNAYIIYSLSEAGVKDLDLEYKKALDEAKASMDMYRLALLANTAFNLGYQTDYEDLINFYLSKKPVGLDMLKAETSMVSSTGVSLRVETIALWTIALMKSKTPNIPVVDECVRFLIANRRFGQYGSTQATVLSLMALTDYASLVRRSQGDAVMELYVNGDIKETIDYQSSNPGRIQTLNFGSILTDGPQKVRVVFKGTKEPFPYSLDVDWKTTLPQSSEDCKVRLSTQLSAQSVNLNETVRLSIKMANKTSHGLPMTMAVVGIPSGLSAQPWQLKELQEKKVFDFYEIVDGKLNIYFTTLSASATKQINLDLKAEIPGTYTGAASSAYLYYTNEFRHWVQGNTITVN